jgi:hypothetical protein
MLFNEPDVFEVLNKALARLAAASSLQKLLIDIASVIFLRACELDAFLS